MPATPETIDILALGPDDLTMYQVASTRNMLASLLDTAPGTVLDFSAVSACDTAGVQLLLAYSQELERRGLSGRIGTLPEAVSAALGRCGLETGDILIEADGGNDGQDNHDG